MLWSEQHVSPEYQLVEQLCAHTKGLLLLTATPEQAGIESHFARLHLLDPSRFHDFARFQQEASQYKEINHKVQELLQQHDAQADNIKELLDSHGTSEFFSAIHAQQSRVFLSDSFMPTPSLAQASTVTIKAVYILRRKLTIHTGWNKILV